MPVVVNANNFNTLVAQSQDPRDPHYTLSFASGLLTEDCIKKTTEVSIDALSVQKEREELSELLTEAKVLDGFVNKMNFTSAVLAMLGGVGIEISLAIYLADTILVGPVSGILISSVIGLAIAILVLEANKFACKGSTNRLNEISTCIKTIISESEDLSMTMFVLKEFKKQYENIYKKPIPAFVCDLSSLASTIIRLNDEESHLYPYNGKSHLYLYNICRKINQAWRNEAVHRIALLEKEAKKTA